MDWKKIAIIVLALLIIGAFIYWYVSRCDYDNPAKRYVAKSVSECARIDYVCRAGEGYFQDKCGCGCELVESPR